MLEEREKNILELVVREYIQCAEPVSSERIAHRLGNALSPASVRAVFSDLTAKGYVEQPHTSGGRVPRSRGYRFFADSILEGEAPESLSGVLAPGHDYDIEHLQEEIAENFHMLSCVAGLRPVGFEEVLGEPEFYEPGNVRELGLFLDGVDEYTEKFGAELDPRSLALIIGDENTIQPLPHISIFLMKMPDAEMFFMAGPTRIHYDRIIHFISLWRTSDYNKNRKRKK